MEKKHEKYMQRAVLDLKDSSSSYTVTKSKDLNSFQITLEGYGCFFANSGYFTERAGFNSFLLLYTFGGSGKIRTLNGESILGAGSVVVINCMEYQAYKTLDSKGWNFKWFHFKGSLAASFEIIINENGLRVFREDELVEIKSHIDTLFLCASKNTAHADLLCQSKIITILNNLTEITLYQNLKENSKNENTSIEKAISLIHKTYSQPISLDMLSSFSNVSKYHFIRLFKAYTGLTPYEYVLSYRINESKKILCQSNKPISFIATACGFSDSTSYIRGFKRLCNVTPNVYRKEKGFPL